MEHQNDGTGGAKFIMNHPYSDINVSMEKLLLSIERKILIKATVTRYPLFQRMT